MDKDTGTTMKSIMLVSAFRRLILATQRHAFLDILCCTNVFSIRACADVYGLPRMV